MVVAMTVAIVVVMVFSMVIGKNLPRFKKNIMKLVKYLKNIWEIFVKYLENIGKQLHAVNSQ